MFTVLLITISYNIFITLTCYSHVLEEMKLSATDKLDSIFTEVLTPQAQVQESDSVTEHTVNINWVGVNDWGTGIKKALSRLIESA